MPFSCLSRLECRFGKGILSIEERLTGMESDTDCLRAEVDGAERSDGVGKGLLSDR